jgi:ankyrin repeat protein
VAHGASIRIADKWGYTPLHMAAWAGSLRITQLLLHHDVNTGALDRCGRTALHVAVQEGQADVVEALLVANAHPNALDRDGLTPLHVAVIGDQHAFISQLVQAGALVATPPAGSPDGSSVLSFAIQRVVQVRVCSLCSLCALLCSFVLLCSALVTHLLPLYPHSRTRSLRLSLCVSLSRLRRGG